mmetsp:Transcript_93619/g.244212  ORF Transcript_93619/g.244212 Transcript_93619/m.244212 type:complete len:258 (-) Transcript_93619:75-848(-)
MGNAVLLAGCKQAALRHHCCCDKPVERAANEEKQVALEGISTFQGTEEEEVLRCNAFPLAAAPLNVLGGNRVPPWKVTDARGKQFDKTPDWLVDSLQFVSTERSFPDGSLYIGQLLGQLREGRGVLRDGAGGEYEGFWHEDKFHGSGRQLWKDGRCFEGQFLQGRFVGLGRFNWTTPGGALTYDGEYSDDRKHGQGKLMWPDGRSYDGGWLSGRKHDRGESRTQLGDVKVGYWAEDRLIRWETQVSEEEDVNIMLRT